MSTAAPSAPPLESPLAGRQWLRAGEFRPLGQAPVGVDREHQVVRGYVVAELGKFKTAGRGEFDAAALEKIVELGNAQPKGLKSRFGHPGLSADGLGKYLGRAKNFRLADGGTKVRADLHLDPTSLRPSPEGGGTPLGEYVLALAESDPGAFSSSLVLRAEKIYTLDEQGRRKKGPDGNELPPLWKPTELHASDVVDTGEAVNDFLSSGLDLEALPDAGVRYAAGLLDQLFAGADRATVADRCTAFLDRYLSRRFGADPMTTAPAPAPAAPGSSSTPDLAALSHQVAQLAGQFAAAQQANAELLAALQADRQQLAAEQAKSKRSAEIAALCQLARSADAAKFIADETLSVEAVRATLFEQLAAKSALSAGGADPLGAKPDPEQKYREEFAASTMHAKLGVTEAEYIAQRRREDGLDQRPAPLSVEWSQARLAAAGAR